MTSSLGSIARVIKLPTHATIRREYPTVNGVFPYQNCVNLRKPQICNSAIPSGKAVEKKCRIREPGGRDRVTSPV